MQVNCWMMIDYITKRKAAVDTTAMVVTYGASPVSLPASNIQLKIENMRNRNSTKEKPAQEDLPKINGEAAAGPLKTTTPETLAIPSPVKAR